MSYWPTQNTAGGRMAVKLNPVPPGQPCPIQLECRYCGPGDHNTEWHEQQEKGALEEVG